MLSGPRILERRKTICLFGFMFDLVFPWKKSIKIAQVNEIVCIYVFRVIPRVHPSKTQLNIGAKQTHKQKGF